MTVPGWWKERDRAMTRAEASELYVGELCRSGDERVVLGGAGSLYAYQLWIEAAELGSWREIVAVPRAARLLGGRKAAVFVRTADLRSAVAALPDDPVECYEGQSRGVRAELDALARWPVDALVLA